ncbi:nucleosome assembly protein 1;1-like [Mangifera indica]|uniref:nucleosome assembly protein 1;1-like n=1 Tax=Mangifera indica TaxID=29780 RepID=UPI001CF9E655|nr:nucleosome assembly protein 1;1-like [Mangifera indica]
MGPMEIVDDDDVEFFMVVARSSQGEDVYDEERENHPTNEWAYPQSFEEFGGNYDVGDDNDDNMDEDYDVEGNEDEEDDDDEDEEFSRFDDNIYGVQSQDADRSQSHTCYDEAECSTRRHDFMNIGAYPSHIHNPNPFQ